MRLNRLWLTVFTAIFACGALFSAPAFSASKDKEKQTKTTKVVVKTAKSPKKQKTVRVTVTRSAEPAVAARPSLATALGLRGQHDELSLKSSVVMVVNQDTKKCILKKIPR